MTQAHPRPPVALCVCTAEVPARNCLPPRSANAPNHVQVRGAFYSLRVDHGQPFPCETARSTRHAPRGRQRDVLAPDSAPRVALLPSGGSCRERMSRISPERGNLKSPRQSSSCECNVMRMSGDYNARQTSHSAMLLESNPRVNNTLVLFPQIRRFHSTQCVQTRDSIRHFCYKQNLQIVPSKIGGWYADSRSLRSGEAR